MRKDVKSFVRECQICQQVKYETSKSSGLLQPLPIPEGVFEELSMDFITGLPTSKGFTTILVVVDRLSKFAYFGSLPASYTAAKVAALFCDLIVRVHVFGKPPTLIPFYPRGLIKLEAIDTMLQQHNDIMKHLKLHLQRAQNRMKIQYDKHHKERSFQVGDQVWVRLQPYRQVTVERRANHKLSKRFFGPFEVSRVMGPAAYEVKLPQGCQIHPVFHVSQLKPCVGTQLVTPHPLPSFAVDNKPVQVPLAVLSERVVSSNNQQVREFLIQWSHSVPEDATWEKGDDLQRCYPNLDLEDKVTCEEQGNITSRRRSNRERRDSVLLADYVA
ncbi:uncharacterized protein LOC133298304 [Gastrolobium bilobum]|uniref:uncharacterized protein LOC133298304 n=1 Tax=Gastrolobium bilobum TaxID=150636 RepID=UPI002AB2488A|nr:uncharacterized protein LOC133298304 [Gastrolobium bilobum]